MPYLVIKHRVSDYEKWKPVYDAHVSTRRENGEKTGQIFHSEDDPNNLVIFFEWDDIDNARKFVSSEDLREAMKRAGVSGEPEFYFLNEGERETF